MKTLSTPLRHARALALRSLLPIALALPGLAQDHRPVVFQDLGFEAGRKAAADKGGLLILDAMTSWCGPCKQMDRTTWIDPRLVEWIGEHAVAIQLDMDEHTALKESLEIRAFPTIVMFKDGEEFDRVVGLRSADEMLEWLGAATDGKRAKDTVLERLAELRVADDAGRTWNERAALVQDLMWFKEYDEALVEHLWLWANLPEGSDHRRQSYRWSTQRFSMRDLAGVSPVAAKAFRGLRDAAKAGATSTGASAHALRDWLELNFVIDDEEATVRWASSVVDTPEGLVQVRALEGRLFDLLVDSGQWRTAGLALRDPLERTRRDRDDLGAYDEDAPSKGEVIPAIPMGGGMQPAKALPVDASTESAPKEAAEPIAQQEKADLEEEGAKARKSVPMIPMTPQSPQRKAMPAIPMTPQTPKGKSMPAIPMGGGAAAGASAEETVAEQVRRLLTEQFRRNSARRYGALLAADRLDEAGSVAEVVLDELDDVRARAAMMAAALSADALGSARERHQSWLDEMAR